MAACLPFSRKCTFLVIRRKTTVNEFGLIELSAKGYSRCNFWSAQGKGIFHSRIVGCHTNFANLNQFNIADFLDFMMYLVMMINFLIKYHFIFI